MLETPINTSPKLRAADIAYDAIESMIVNLRLKPGSPIIESELLAMTGMGRTPMREALMRMSSNGLILQLPRRGLVVSDIEAAEHMSLIETRRAIERVIAGNAAKRITATQKTQLVSWASKMVSAAQKADLVRYMRADQALDEVLHAACQNPSAVAAVTPLIIKCRRFWHAFQYTADINEPAALHLQLAEAISTNNETQALQAADNLMDYLEMFTRQVLGNPINA